MPPIGVAVLQDGLDKSGHWSQVVQLTIEPGGTLGDASLVAFGDQNHIDALFAAAKRRDPRLASPAVIPMGQMIDLTIDPTTSYILQSVVHANNSLTRHFTNGVINVEYARPEGSLSRIIEFPDRQSAVSFEYQTSQGSVKVPSGGKLTDLIYAKGESFGDVVRQIYGFTTYPAAADLVQQTGWDPTRWPPPTGDPRRILVGAAASYQTRVTSVTPPPNPDPVGQAQLSRIVVARHAVGIDPTRLETFGEVLHVALNDPSLTARDVSILIYGTPERARQIAAAAGFRVPATSNPAAASFNPSVFGRAFDVTVDDADEHFIVRRTATSDGRIETELADGAQIMTYPTSTSGPVRMVAYPSGYQRVTYRPPQALLTVAQGLALYHVAVDQTLSPSAATAATRQYEAQVIWRLAPDFPRSTGQTADSLQVVDSPAGTYVTALLAPPGPRTALQRAIDLLRLSNPIVATIGLVVFGSLVMTLVGLLQRPRARVRRIRW